MRLLGLVVIALVAGCGTTVGTTAGGDCTSHYEDVVTAPTLRALRKALVDGSVPGGHATRVVGHHDGKTTLDVLDRRHRRIVQLDAWRDDRTWYAGQWAQCTD